MKTNNLFVFALLALLCISCCKEETPAKKGPAYSDTLLKEQLGRGLVAIHNGGGKVTLSWRYLESDPLDVAFDVYRTGDDGTRHKLNSSPLTSSTFFTDEGVDTSVTNSYLVLVSGKEEAESGASYTLTPQKALKPYLEIPIKAVEGYAEGYYSPNDGTVADLDGDGEYEIIVKLETRSYDNAHRGLCNEGCLLDAYKTDGTFMWRVNLGLNIRQGAHYTQLMAYDFDGDGKAELAVKTAEGTTFGDGQFIGDVNSDGITDYRDTDPESRTYGKVMSGPEFLSVIDGLTGKELARADFIPRGDKFEFGDNTGNRVDRFLGGAGYFDGKMPSILICRGYYVKTVLEAFDYRDGKLTKRWTFDTTANNDEYIDYEKQGNHNLRIGDVDGDGKDEVVYGACVIDHDGTGLYTTGYGHGDAMHMSDLIPSREGLEVWQCHETSPLGTGSEMRDAATGQLIWGYPSISDVGRAMTADIDPRFPGWEAWSSGTDGTYTADGRKITSVKPSVNFAIWWDGDLNRELLDGYMDTDPSERPLMMQQRRPEGGMRPPQAAPGATPPPAATPNRMMPERNRYMRISKWNGEGVDYFILPGEAETAANNGTKSNPVLSADVLGDWREELIVRTSDNKTLRIYTTDIPTEYRFHTMMSDVIYRMSVLCENIAYNQPPEPGYYMGSDLGKFWAERRVRNGVAARNSKSANDLNARLAGTSEMLVDSIVVGKSYGTEYVLDARLDYDSYEWTLNGKKAGEGRTVVIRQSEYGYDKPVSVHIRTTYKGEVFEGSGTVTFSSEEGTKGVWDARDAQRTGNWEY